MSRRAWAAFAAVATLWGIPYLFIKIAVDDRVPPVFLAWARIVLGAALLLAVAARARLLGRLRGRWRAVSVYAVVEIALTFPLISFGETRVSSSLTAILIAAVPIFIALLALRFDRDERVTGLRLVGLLVGFGGVVALVGIDVAGEPSELVGAGAVLLAALGYAAGPMWLNRRLADLDARATMAGSLGVAAVVLTPVVAFAPPTEVPSAGALASIAVLGIFCTAAAFVLFGMLVAEVGPARAAIITYVAPVVAVVLGVVLLGERLGPGALVGMALILAGSWLATGGRLRRRYVPKSRSPASPRPGRM
jgi:drug/metabolite transporter (DMT)-like permease